MTIGQDWPDFKHPELEVKLDVTGGTLTFVSPSKLINHAGFDVANGEVRGAVFKNGTKAATISIDSSTGALSIAGFSVSTGDVIEVRLQATMRTSLPWFTHARLTRSAFATVPSGNSQTTFGRATNPACVPGFDLAFGWDANDNLKVGVKVTSSDGASQSQTMATRLHGTCPSSSSSSTFSMTDTVNAQYHTSSFARSGMDAEAVIEWSLQSAGSTPYQKDTVLLAFEVASAVPAFPGSFPSAGNVHLRQAKVAGTAELDLSRP
ncbi:MAG: hypothetical protein ACOZNI_08440 [Myxococcota bacterium]